MELTDYGIPRLLIADDNENIHEDIRFILNPVPGGAEDPELLRLKADLFSQSFLIPPPIPDIRYRIEDAWQGEEAVRMVADAVASGDPYVIVFLDVKMPPGMDGIQTIGRLWEKDPQIEIVICTAYSDYTWEQILVLYGQTDRLLFVRKPFDSVSIKQIALSLTTKSRLNKMNRDHIKHLEAEVGRRTEELERTVDRLTAEIALRRDREFQLSRLAHYDTLTGLLNRHSFYGRVGEIAAGLKPSDHEPTHALLFVDIDGFKLVNDAWGHDVGDLVLVEIAARLRQSAGDAAVPLQAMLVESDVPPRVEAAVFRFGGDEFTLLLEYRGRENVQALAELILRSLAAPIAVRGEAIHIACSIGVSLLQGDAADFGTLLKHADMAMYKAKELGGACVFHDQLRGTGWMDPVDLAADIGSLMDGEQMEVHYQTVVGDGNRPAGMASLVRWRHPRYGIVLPEDFIPIAERMGLLTELETRVLRIACRQAASLSGVEYRSLFVMVHCSSVLFYMPGFPALLVKILSESGLGPERLTLSLEEQVLSQDREAAARVLAALTNAGVRITVETSGAVQSLNMLLRSLREGDSIQLDRSLLANVTRRESDRLYLWNLLDIVRNHSLGVLIGGVETASQDELLQKRNCLRHGFFYGPPVPFDAFVRDIMQSGT